ncbi:unnamed protein product [Cladocopium goreaui]|uniref:Uncharacterized protein n=1 Tax=Cladocopium goreaui TaxID=2562237 RepID=A0A9P1D993_9DINO|nr:unnamed protein product [Cladocopium goreaui]
MLTKYYPLWCPEATKRQPAQPPAFDFWLSSLRSPEFKVNVQQHKGHDYQRFYTEAYKKKHLKVLDIVEIDQVKETFTATFKMEFDYVDPTLITTWQIIKYLKTEGPTTSVVTVEAHILGYEPGDSEKQKVVLGKGHKTTRDMEDTICKDDLQVEYDRYLSVPKKDLLSVSLPERHNWQDHVALKWSLMNAVLTRHELMCEDQQINFFDEYGGHVTRWWKMQATFSDRLHLENMPFDRQLLRIQVVGEIPTYMMKFEPLLARAGNLKTVEAREDRNLPVQWTVEDAPPVHLQVIKEHGEFSRARFDLHIYVERNPRFYTINVCLFVWLFTMGTGVAFTRGTGTYRDGHKKMDCLLTLLLTTVAYKIILAAWLPVKPYLTKLDCYLVLCFCFQVLVIAYVAFQDFWDAKAESILNKDGFLWQYGYEFGASWVYGTCFLGHLCLATMIHFDCKRGILRRESWHEVYKRKFVWPPGTSLKGHLVGDPPDERAGKPEESDDSESEAFNCFFEKTDEASVTASGPDEDSDGDHQKLLIA